MKVTESMFSVFYDPPAPGIWVEVNFLDDSMDSVHITVPLNTFKNRWEYFEEGTTEREGGKFLMLVQNAIHDEEAIEGWFWDLVYNNTALVYPWDWSLFDGTGVKKEFTYRKFKFGKDITYDSLTILEEKDIEKHPDKEIMKSFVAPTHYRLCGDYLVYHGDGGETPMHFPVYYQKNLGVSTEARERISYELFRLNKERGDVQANGVVQDIIDPDLGPYKRTNPDWKTDKLEQNNIRQKRLKDINRYPSTDERRYKRDIEGIVLTDATNVRNSYSWLPAEFYISEDMTVTIKSPIHNLPFNKENKALYTCIVKVFRAMLPMFASVGVFKPGTSTTLQVVVKAQNYCLSPGMTYHGKWHTEGFNENIVAGGVYYCHVSPGLEGGNIKFRPPKIPHSDDLHKNLDVPIEEGCAVVFANTIPHRLRKLRNIGTDTKSQNRLFINFFIVDPLIPIVSTKSFPTVDFLFPIVKKYIEATVKSHFPKELVNKILSFVPGLFPIIEEAKHFRQKSRDAMAKNKSGWGWIHWGNVGEIIMCNSFEQLLPNIKYNASSNLENELMNTDSQ